MLLENLPRLFKMRNVSIRSDHGCEFQNEDFESFCEKNGINHNFSAPRTPQQRLCLNKPFL